MTLSLLVFFLRARPVRVGGIVLASAVAVVVLLVGVLQALSLSGAQTADTQVGRFDNALLQAADVPVGANPTRQAAAITAALSTHNARNPTVGYSAYQVSIDGAPDTGTTVQENDWSRTPFPVAYTLQAGSWPASGEVVVSAALASKYPRGSTISFFDGALSGSVSGIVTDVYHRGRLLVLVPPGSVASLSVLDAPKAERFATTFNTDVYWDGPAGAGVRKALQRVIVGAASDGDGFGPAIETRTLLSGRRGGELIEIGLAALLLPFLAGIIAVRFGARFVSRIRGTMHTLGVPASRTGRAGLGAIIVAGVVGTVSGLAVGYLLLFAVRPLIDLVADSVLGPVAEVPALSGRAMLAALGGTLIGMAIFGRVGTAASTRRPRSRFGLTLRQALPAISLACLFVGIWFAQSNRFDDRILALLAFGVAIVVLAPFVLDIVTRRDPSSYSGRLGIRRLRADRRASAWVVAAVGTLLLTSFGILTYVTSAVAAGNATTESLVPPHQVQLTVPAGAGDAERSVRAEFEEFVGATRPLSVRTADAEPVLGDGGVLVLRSVVDVQRYSGVSLTPPQRALLESGGVLRTKLPDVSRLTLEVSRSTAKEAAVRRISLRSALLDGLDPSYTVRSGMMLASTAEARNIPVGTRFLVYTGLSPDQVLKASRAPGELGFDPDWVESYKAPDTFTEPLSVTLAAGGLALVGTLLLVYYAAASASALRPNLAGLRAIGMRHRWLLTALGVQLGAVVGTALVVAVVAALVGVLVMLRFAGSDLALTLPWRAIGVQVFVTLAGSVAAVAIASRRLRPDERVQ